MTLGTSGPEQTSQLEKGAVFFPQKPVTVWWGRQGAVELTELQSRSGLLNSVKNSEILPGACNLC